MKKIIFALLCLSILFYGCQKGFDFVDNLPDVEIPHVAIDPNSLPDETIISTPQYIPDEYFRQYCLFYLDENKDGKITVAEARSAKTIRPRPLNYKWIRSMAGIEFFTGLEHLECVDLARIGLHLDLTYNTQLKKLIVENNLLRLKKIVFPSEMPKLEELKLINCNQLTTINLEKMAGLKSINLNLENLENLELGEKPLLANLVLYNSIKMNSLDLSQCPQLDSLLLNRGSLTELDLSSSPDLSYFFCESMIRLDLLHIEKNKKLKEFSCNGSARDFDLSHLTELTKLSVSGLTIPLDLSNHTQLEYLNCVNVRVNLEKLHLLKQLRYLNVTDCNISEIDLQQVPQLEILHCEYNLSLTTLDTSPCTNLSVLNINDNTGIKKIDLSKNSKLTTIYVRDLPLKDLDLSQNPLVETIFCSSAPTLKTIYVSDEFQIRSDSFYKTFNAVGVSIIRKSDGSLIYTP